MSDQVDCPFCKIVWGEEPPPALIAEGPSWLAFFPLEPATRGHTLVVPRKHVADLWDADKECAAELIGAVQRVGRAIDTALQPDGMNLITSSGQVAEQTIFHLHLHVVPRWRHDGFGEIWPPESATCPDRLADAAAAIRGAL